MDAKLYFDGQLTSQTGNERAFETPPLRRGQDFEYELKTEFASGSVRSKTTRVTIRAGETLRLESTPADFRILSRKP